MSITLDLYGFRVYLFDLGDPEEFLLFAWIFQMTLVATGTLETQAKVKYLCTLFHGGAFFVYLRVQHGFFSLLIQF